MGGKVVIGSGFLLCQIIPSQCGINFCLLRAQMAMSKREGELPAVTDGECVTKTNDLSSSYP